MMVDKKEYTFQFDELQLPEDEAGNLKIDAKGNLLGGREFKARTFTSPYRADPEKVYSALRRPCLAARASR
jgi:chromatin structure-remodeling complex protein RSC7